MDNADRNRPPPGSSTPRSTSFGHVPEWNGHTYVLLERLLFDLDDVLRRQVGISKLPAAMLPRETDIALTHSSSLCFDAARVLHEEKQRLEVAKVEHDRQALT
jgi:hypothetical protein